MSASVKRSHDLGTAVAHAAWWSTLTQVISKLISPITTMVLARILTPRAFGIVALSTMVTSLSNMFSDAGFQRYLVQEQFRDQKEESRYASTAFWTNMAVSLLLVLLIAIFRNPLAVVVGAPGYGLMLVVSSLSIPLTALSGVQTALYQKRLDFKTLFGSRVGSSLLIFVVSVPLALAGSGYWALVVGNLVSNIFLAIWLTILSDWKPRLFYSWTMMLQMLSFGIWILIESFATWLNTWLGTFIISRLLTPKYVGYYNTSVNMASSITAVVTEAIIPVAYATFSKVKENRERFTDIFFRLQKYLGMVIIPVAVGCLVFNKLITLILLGRQWLGTSFFFGFWMLSGCTVVVFGYLCSEAYRALGKPKWCVVVQIAYLLPFVPTLYLGAKFGYNVFSIVVPLGRLSLCLIHLVVAKIVLDISPWRMIVNLRWTYLQTICAMIPGIVVVTCHLSIVWQVIAAISTVVIYVALLFAVPNTRRDALYVMQHFLSKKIHVISRSSSTEKGN